MSVPSDPLARRDASRTAPQSSLGPPFSPQIKPAPAPLKPSLRRHFREQRRAAVAAAPGALAAAAAAAVPTLLVPPLRLGLYWPIGQEPDLRPLVDLLPIAWRSHLALPAIRGDRLIYLPWQPGDPLATDGAGIPAPLGERGLAPGQLGLLLVPALAVDRSGIRLGYGGGWYDRLRSDPLWQAVPALVVVPAVCVVPRLPCDCWDVPFPGWLEETGLQWRSPSVATS
ncbi:MAG: 5-formyltetrahydrofolate cyclo-ligase [Cyanobacteriota bacterium]